MPEYGSRNDPKVLKACLCRIAFGRLEAEPGNVLLSSVPSDSYRTKSLSYPILHCSTILFTNDAYVALLIRISSFVAVFLIEETLLPSSQAVTSVSTIARGLQRRCVRSKSSIGCTEEYPDLIGWEAQEQ